MQLKDKKVQKAWTFYDWANSVYPLVISSAIFPIFYEGYVDSKVMFFGFEFINTALITILSAVYFLLLVFILPFLSGIADAFNNKKVFMRFFCYLGSFSCILLSFFDKNHLEISLLLFVLTGIGYWSSLVFYNAFLPEIADKKDHDSLSARGFSMGYIGSVILLIVCLILIFSSIEEQRPFYTRLCFALTGLWWFGFSHVTFRRLPSGKKVILNNKTTYQKGITELKKVWKYILKTKRLKRFIYSFFVYSMAVQTIMLVAVYFGTKEINWGSGSNAKMGLIISILLIQLIAIPGAILLSKISKMKGNLFALKLSIFIWILLCFSAFLVYEPIHFYFIAGFVGLVMGGIQSLSRSTFSKYIPKATKDTSSFFSFFDISEKLGIVIGMFSYGFIEQITGSMRNSIVALVVFFIIGLLLLFQVPKEEISIEAYG
ncbi:MAG: MFS transporter [Parvicellaceae bacterium]